MMEEEKDFIMRQIKQIAKNLGSFLSKESLREFINYDQSSEESLSDEELDQILLISSLEETIRINQLSEDFVKSETGFSAAEIENAHNLEFIINDQQQQKINSLLKKYHSQLV